MSGSRILCLIDSHDPIGLIRGCLDFVLVGFAIKLPCHLATYQIVQGTEIHHPPMIRTTVSRTPAGLCIAIIAFACGIAGLFAIGPGWVANGDVLCGLRRIAWAGR